ncbi:MAG: glycosyltransferase [Actinomycetota bacterium]
MIFVTVGTLHYPFERLMRSVRALPAGEVVVQHGPADPPPGVARAKAFMPFNELNEAIEDAGVVVTHAGCGTIAVATRAGHTPVVLPRLRRYGEHVDDHQLELAGALADEGKVIVVSDGEDLSEALKAVPPRRPPAVGHGGPLQKAVRAALLGQEHLAGKSEAPHELRS